MNPNKNLSKRISNMSNNPNKYFDNLNDQMKQAFVVIRQSNEEILRLTDKVNQLEKEKQRYTMEFEDKEKTDPKFLSNFCKKLKLFLNK